MTHARPAGAADTAGTGRAADALMCGALFLFTVWYCASAPYNLYVYDEGYFLYEAKRIVDGEVFYRDFFNIVTPLGWYVIAAAYWLFGISMATARTTMAVIHGIIAVCMVVACRRMGIRLSIAAVVGLSEAAICYIATERAAPHWFGTLFCCWIFLALLWRPLRTAGHSFVVGALVGGLLLTQQQRGMAMLWVPIAVLLLDRWLMAVRVSAGAWEGEAPAEPPATPDVGGPDGSPGGSPSRSERLLDWWATPSVSPPPRGGEVKRGLLAYAAGVAVAVVPVMLTFVMLAGFENVYDALVQYPLVNYRAVHSTPWGAYNPIQDPYIGPVVKYLSLIVPMVALFLWVREWRRATRPAIARALAVAWLVSVGAFMGVLYVPGYGYLVLVGPVWFALVAYVAETAARASERRAPRWRVAAVAVVAAFALLFAGRLALRRRELNAQWPYRHDTPFGRVNFASLGDIAVNDAVRSIAATTAGGELFVYPTAPGLYLLTGTDNISRFQVLSPGYSSPAHVQEVLDLLERRQQPLVVRNWIWMRNDLDPILPYLMRHYEKVKLPYPPKQMPTLSLFRRKPHASAAPSS